MPIHRPMTLTDRTLTSRYEFKYWLHPSKVRRIRDHIQPFVEPDRFARTKRGYRYRISSLYLDTPAHDLYQTTVEGHKNRFKLRIRTYNDEANTPAFLEIKKRMDQVVLKDRAAISRTSVADFLGGKPVNTEGLAPDAVRFIQETRRLHASPVLRVRYMREAYESVGLDPVRVTFDTGVQFKPSSGPSLGIEGEGWSDTPNEGVILEVKFTDTYPVWVDSLVRELELDRMSIPKYVMSMDQAAHQAGRAPGLSARTSTTSRVQQGRGA